MNLQLFSKLYDALLTLFSPHTNGRRPISTSPCTEKHHIKQHLRRTTNAFQSKLTSVQSLSLEKLHCLRSQHVLRLQRGMELIPNGLHIDICCLYASMSTGIPLSVRLNRFVQVKITRFIGFPNVRIRGWACPIGAPRVRGDAATVC